MSTSRSASVSPGKPTMTLERTPASRGQGTYLLEEAQEALGVAEAAHPPQHRAAGVLEGEVEVRRDARRAGDRLDQPRTGLGGLEVGDPHPVDAVDGGELGQQRLEEADVAEVLAVGRGVLADQEQLAGTLGGQPAGLLDHLGRAAADEGAAEARDRAEGAAAVAATGELEARGRTLVEADPQAGRRVAGDASRGVSWRCVTGLIGSSWRRSLGTWDWWARRPGSPGAARRCRGSRRTRAPRRPRAGSRRGRRRTSRRGSPTATTARVRPESLRSAASSSVSTESFLACSTNPQVLTITVSASAGSATRVNPPAASRPASSSESTSLRAQPKVTSATEVVIGLRV